MLGIAVAGVLAAVISIAVGEGGPRSQEIGGVNPVQQTFGGIPQEGAELGEEDALVVVSVFTDLRCPECADYQVEVIDPLVEQLARTGRARFELRHYSLGAESTTLAAAASVAAGRQDRQWQYADLLLRNLERAGAEVDEEFLIDVADSVPELEVELWDSARASEEVADAVAADAEEGAALELLSEGPSVLVSGPDGTRELGVEPSAPEILDAVEAFG